MVSRYTCGVLLVVVAAGFAIGLIGCDESTKTATLATNPDIALEDVGLSEDGWFLSFDQAMAESQETGKPILVDFTGSDWCTWCIRLHDEVFSKREFKEWADQNVVLLELDFPRRGSQPKSVAQQNDALAKKFGVRGFPTVLFLDGQGEVIGKYGYDKGGPSNWIANAEEFLAAK